MRARELGARRVAEHVQRVLALAEHPLRAAADEDRRSRGHRLLDHVRRHLEDALLTRRQRRRSAPSRHLGRAQRQRVRESLGERRHPLLALRPPPRRGTPSRCATESTSALSTSCQPSAAATRAASSAPARADHSRDGDQRHRASRRSAEMTDAQMLDDLKAERIPDGVRSLVLDGVVESQLREGRARGTSRSAAVKSARSTPCRRALGTTYTDEM